jgi:glycosyltransferase involved in cell wall biosynthesis
MDAAKDQTGAGAPAPRVAVFLSALHLGGAERVLLHLGRAFAASGCPVDLVLIRRVGPLGAEIPPSLNVVEIGEGCRLGVALSLLRLGRHRSDRLARRLLPFLLACRERPPGALRGLPRLVSYLRSSRPAALLTTLPNNNLAALWARDLAGAGTRVIIREANMITIETEQAPGAFGRSLTGLIRDWYATADGIVAVSDGVADDLAGLGEVSRARIRTIYNPIDLPRIEALAAAVPDDPWLSPGAPPVFVAVGRLYPQKDYPTLLRAFARVRSGHRARLIICGEGPDRRALEALAANLGVADAVRLPGIVANPYALMAHAAALVLSSAWEGLPNVIIEALACGCPVVSTDCPSGPSELLEGGRFGTLVPVGDDEALARGMIARLEGPGTETQPGALRQRAALFSLDRAASAYLEELLGPATQPA